MKILYIGKIENIVKTLEELGAQVVSDIDICDGILVTDKLTPDELSSFTRPDKPLIVSGCSDYSYTDINVLVLDEEGVVEFYKMHSIIDLQSCKDMLTNLRIE